MPRSSGHASAVVRRAVFIGAAALLIAATANASPTLGFHEEFNGGGVDAWTGGSAPTNPGTGGVGGAGDGYLLLANPSPAHFGAFSADPAFVGNWTTAGITQIRVYMNDVGAADDFQIHLALGSNSNFWQRDAAIVPPHGQWAEFVIPLDGPTGWTRIIGTTGTFAQALTNVVKIHFRHDLPAFSQMPDDIAGDLGIDRILLTNGTVDVGDGPVAGVTRAIEMAAPYPNPARGPVTVAFTQFEAAGASIAIFDITGRRIRSAKLSEAGPGARTWLWDGLDDGGRRVAAGAYHVQVSGPHGGESRAIVRVD